jgi:hypothetical protein
MAVPPLPAGPVLAPVKAATFEHVYHTAVVKPAKLPYDILKVADMAGSPYLAGLSLEARKAAVMMALDAAGVRTEDLLQDLVVRQRALNDYEEAQHKKLTEFAAVKIAENDRIQAELDRTTATARGRIQVNLDEVEHEQEEFRAWQRRKQQECQRITEAAQLCVPQEAVPGNGLAVVLERTAARK